MSYWNWLPSLISAGATIYGANSAIGAQKEALRSSNEANEKATRALIESQDRATAAQTSGIQAAQQVMEGQRRMASPGLMAMQGIIGRGSTLTPQQEQAIADARRMTLDSLQGNRLRGSARATVSAVRDVEGRMRGDFLSSNQQRSDSAASNLSGQYFNAGKNISDLNLAGGNAVSSGLLNTGQFVANNINQSGQNLVNTNLNQNYIKGAAVGDIASVIADQMKQEHRSRYEPVKTSGAQYDEENRRWV